MDPENQQQQQAPVPKEIVQFYKEFRNKSDKLKKKIIGNVEFEISDRYEILEQIGQGAYGVVVAAKDKLAPKDKRLVAIKKVQIAFEHKLYTKRTLRELRLQRLLQHDNILGVNTLLLPKSREDFDYIYIVSDLMETDLYQIIKSDQQLSDDHCQFFLYQILRGLKYVHSANVVHRDLKPRNLLVNKNCDLKICDLGLARAITPQEGNKTRCLTDYIVTRWYRAPELLLSYKEYDAAVDIWSVGCIFAELLNRKTFLRGNSKLIFENLGTPSEQEISQIPKKKYRDLVRQFLPKQPKPWQRLFPRASPEAIDLLSKLLCFDSKKRLTAAQALEHPYLTDFHLPEDEPTRQPVNPLEFEFDDYNLNKHQLKA
ncbi:Protein kinase-like domain [Pseudocohnilembus persalinus]|uniref:Mitogen-activated protein kinase n=1 Tax=Pseudocohnilembus persalinus TaxID=266149 RepID=A0A0V0R3R2_PSEPJ|nr:Protein kinase-like domain [Pseudocohnilembus persalinus]|eukprot:KRX09132.1 Protein kinase-like domain [Pseudocohnilembus persalinus]